ncbi:unnamed protein product [Polarella glacialis]|uniref:Uncharacterized protein n=1 Tax=Polarella glacialis TaxID=89957 RepID=A0A813M137_POLGL|nr:unnamed protein product [Polarella glacialis]
MTSAHVAGAHGAKDSGLRRSFAKSLPTYSTRTRTAPSEQLPKRAQFAKNNFAITLAQHGSRKCTRSTGKQRNQACGIHQETDATLWMQKKNKHIRDMRCANSTGSRVDIQSRISGAVPGATRQSHIYYSIYYSRASSPSFHAMASHSRVAICTYQH